VEHKNCTLVEMAMTMLDKHRTPRCFWADAISTTCYISNRIFLRSILHLTPFKLRFGRKPSVSHLRHFGCKCFILNHDNLDKFESHSSDDILLRYTPHGRFCRVFNLEINTVVESCDMTFDESSSCPRDVFEYTANKEMEESIFIDEKLYAFDDDDDDDPLRPSTSPPESIFAFTLKTEVVTPRVMVLLINY
jgi:hypothetical protein